MLGRERSPASEHPRGDGCGPCAPAAWTQRFVPGARDPFPGKARPRRAGPGVALLGSGPLLSPSSQLMDTSPAPPPTGASEESGTRWPQRYF